MAQAQRQGRPYRALCAYQRGLRLPCWWCGRAIDYTVTGALAQRHPWAFSLDHFIPLSKGGSLLDRTNARSAHRYCNTSRGNRTTIRNSPTSRSW